MGGWLFQVGMVQVVLAFFLKKRREMPILENLARNNCIFLARDPMQNSPFKILSPPPPPPTPPAGISK